MMNKEVITKVLEIAGRLKHVYVATADREGLPHVSAAGKLQVTSEGDLAVSEWFCPGTLSNVQANPKVSLVVWRPEGDAGYQILGNIVEIRDLAMLDGYSPGLREGIQIPQVERQLIIRPEKVLAFQHAPHSDLEE
jgi:hypothetical protein